MAKIKQYVRERDQILRKLDEDALDEHFQKWNLPRPRSWLPSARMILMHKSRLQLKGFSEEERRISREWLLGHNCSLPGSDG